MIHFVTTNEGKFREVQTAFKSCSIELARLSVHYPELQTDTLSEVVEFGLDWLCARQDLNILIDDSGLFVNALGGFPGVFSSHAFRTIGNEGILRLLKGVENRAARFEACFGLLLHGEKFLFTGVCMGTIAHSPRGAGGFGFDPIFIPEGSDRTFAEMSTEEKNVLSHRGRAVKQLLSFLSSKKID